MGFEYITSKDNRLVKQVKKLISSSKERKEAGLFVLEGLRLCADAALNGYCIQTLILSESVELSDKFNVIIDASLTKIKVPDSLFNLLSDTVSPQGVLCVVKIPDNVYDASKIEKGKYIILENTADPANLGTIARTAEALGIDGLIISSVGCDPFSPKAQRASMGALLRLPMYLTSDFVNDIKLLKQKNFSVFASVVCDADCDVSKVDYPKNSAVMIGNEANGLTNEAIMLCDKKITIIMKGRAESLNAAAAASIIMWEMTRCGET